MKRVYKGDFGYINYRKKTGIIRTAIFLAVAVGLFITGLLIYKTQKSVFSILAALACLPTGWSAVNMIMFLKTSSCSNKDHDRIEQEKGGLLVRYDLLITSYETNFKICAATVLDKNICCYSDDENIDADACEKHIKKMMAQNGYGSYSIKVYEDIDGFCNRLNQLESLRNSKNIDPQSIEDSWIPGTAQTPAAILLSISL